MGFWGVTKLKILRGLWGAGGERLSWIKVNNLPASAGDAGLIPWLGRSPGEGNGNPLQYSCLENPMDRGDWWVTVHGVTESDRNEWLSMHIHTYIHTITGILMRERGRQESQKRKWYNRIQWWERGMSQGRWAASRNWKRQEMDSPLESPEGTYLLDTLTLACKTHSGFLIFRTVSY